VPAYQIIISIFLIILSALLTVVILLQQNREAGLSGAITGAADSFLGKNKRRSAEAKLAQITKIVAVCFFSLALIASVLITLFS